MTKEQKKIRKQWVKALRSGKYKKGSGALKQQTDKGERFCCLGVLCDMAVKASVIEPPTVEGPWIAYEGAHGVLPAKVRDWAGLNSSNPVYNYPKGNYTIGRRLASLNDDGKKSFNYIADIIEKHDELFVG